MEYFFGLIVLATAPVLFLLFYTSKHDTLHKEPKGMLIKVFLYGMAITIPIALLGLFLDHLWWVQIGIEGLVYAGFSAFITAALIEEFGKYLVLRRTVLSSSLFDEPIDGVIYGVYASLGFALLENLLYVLQEGVVVAVMRAFMAVPGHALFGGWMGYYLGQTVHETDPQERKNLHMKGLLTAIGLHGMYNFLLMTESAFALGVFPLLFFAFRTLKARVEIVIEQTEQSVGGSLMNSMVIEPPKSTFPWKALFYRVLSVCSWGFVLFLGLGAYGLQEEGQLTNDDATVLAIIASIVLLVAILFWRAAKKAITSSPQ